MDGAGAVDLQLPTTTLRLPPPVAPSQFDQLERRSEAQWDVAPQLWRRQQLVRLAAASALEARLLHVQGARLARFGLSRDPHRVTVAQLAALVRSHHGTAGQAFELAVADAIEHRVPEVLEPVTQGLRLLGVSDADEVRMLVLGLEKVPSAVAAQFYVDLAEALPESARLHSGRSGMRASQETVLRRLSQATWATMGEPDPELRRRGQLRPPDGVSQLGRADALLYTPTALVPASLKVNESMVPHRGWRDVPLWITTSTAGPMRTRRVTTAEHPTYVVSLGGDEWLPVFREALRVIDVALQYADRGGPLPPRERLVCGPPVFAIARRLVQLADLPVAEVARQLRSVDPLVVDLFADRTWARASETEVPVLGGKPMVNAWRQAAEDAGVIRGQQHLFFGKQEGVNRPLVAPRRGRPFHSP